MRNTCIPVADKGSARFDKPVKNGLILYIQNLTHILADI